MPDWQAFQIPAHIEAALVNWGLWGGKSGRSASRKTAPIFRDVAPGLRWSTEPVVPGYSAAIDAAAATSVEATICAPDFSPMFRQLLSMHYVQRAAQAMICRVLHLPSRQFPERRQAAALYFWQRYVADTEKSA